jgi:hypothetical protein
MALNDFQVNGLFPSTVGGTGTTVKYFPRLLGTSIGVESTAPSATSAAGQLVVPGNGVLNGQNFDVQVGGEITSGVSDSSVTVQVALYANTGTVSSPSYTMIATTGNVVAPLESTSYNFNMKVSLFGTTASGVVRGTQYSILGTTQNALAALTNNLSGINFSNAAPFGLVVGVTFNSSDAGNSAALYQFQVGSTLN